MTPWIVRINEVSLMSTGRGLDWWLLFSGAQPDRCRVVMATFGGAVVDVACDDRDHADWLVATMMSHGLPKSALRIRRAAQP